MTTNEVLLAVSASLAVATAWGLVVFFVPWCRVSQFRYCLWRLRDDIMREKRNARICDSDAVADLLSRIESFIRNAGDVTFAKCLPFLCIPHDVVLQHRAKREELVARLSSPDRKAYEVYFQRYRDAVSRHLLFGSPSGWIIWLFGSVGEFLAGAVKRAQPISYARRRVVEATERASEKIAKLLEDRGGNASKQPLSSFA